MNVPLADLARRYREGYTMSRIAADTGIPESTVRTRLQVAGVEIRKHDARALPALIEFDRLDALSRTRALTEQESLTLEHAQNIILQTRAHGIRKELIRRGLRSR